MGHFDRFYLFWLEEKKELILNHHELASFGMLLKAFRMRRNLTQQHLAAALGMHRHTLSRWEQGDFLPASKALVLELARHLKLDDQETRQLLEASLTALAPYWSVPLPRNPFFTGREEILEALHTHLSTDHVVALTQTYAVQGLGGIGKTQIALEYAYRHALEYSAVFWIEAETSETVVSSLLHSAEVLQLPEREVPDQQRVVAAVQRWLSSHRGWLLIWDNLEDLDLLSRLLPAVRQGAVLLTTRCQTLGTLAWGVDLAPMEQEEGIFFVLRRAKMLEPEAIGEHVQQFAARLPGEYAAARELVTTMGGLPLALDQAGSYIDETGCGLAGYLRRYQQQRLHLLARRGTVRADHPHSVVATLGLACQRVAQQHPAALELLRFCAFLYPDAIPEELLLAGASHLGPVLGPVVADISQFDGAHTTLRSFSLVQRHPETHTLSFHRLVQVILQEEMSEQEQAEWRQRAVRLLNEVFPSATYYSGRKEIWEPGERLLPHVMTCAEALSDHLQNQAFADLLRKAAAYLDERSRYELAELLYWRTLRIQEQMVGSEHPNLASVQSKLAYLLRHIGNYEQAEPLFQSAVRVLEQAWGPEHPEVANPLEGLAMVYYEQGKYEQAELLQQRTLRIREQALGPEHPEVALALNRLGNVYCEQNKYEQAEPVYQRALSIWEQAWGPEHLLVARPLNNLGLIYLEQGKYELAESFLQRAVRIDEQTLGSGHPDAAAILGSLADLYREWGKYEQAEPLYQRALSIFEQAFGLEHRLVAYPLHGLALLCREQSNDEEAEALFQRALQIREQRLGQNHPETAQTLHDLALLRQQQGRPGEALSLAQRAFAIRSQSLGEAHPKTVATQALYALLTQKQVVPAEPTVEQLRTFLKARGWSLHLKKRHDKLYVYATRKVGKDTQSRYLAPLSNLAACLVAAGTLPNAKE
jgi:tetratricopeptide (TPR) repeat protein/transcriptional regulator with XRE-family HTH domain